MTIRQVDKNEICELTLEALQKSPFLTRSFRLHKARSRMMLQAMRIGFSIKGNISIYWEDNYFYFLYRGTPILLWDIRIPDGIENINASEYEDTFSTQHQRKQARLAIEEFRMAVLLI